MIQGGQSSLADRTGSAVTIVSQVPSHKSTDSLLFGVSPVVFLDMGPKGHQVLVSDWLSNHSHLNEQDLLCMLPCDTLLSLPVTMRDKVMVLFAVEAWGKSPPSMSDPPPVSLSVSLPIFSGVSTKIVSSLESDKPSAASIKAGLIRLLRVWIRDLPLSLVKSLNQQV